MDRSVIDTGYKPVTGREGFAVAAVVLFVFAVLVAAGLGVGFYALAVDELRMVVAP